MTPRPTVSVILTVFNGENFLPLAVESVLGQTFADFELIIVDDGSTDGTPDQLRAVDDPRLRVIRNSVNKGLPAALNIGIDAATAVYCAFLDHDDIALPTRLQCQVDYLQSHPATGMIGSAIEAIDDSGNVLKTIKMPLDSIAVRWMGLLDCPMRQSSLFGRTEVVMRHRYSTDFPFYPDWDFVMRVARDTGVCNLPEALVQYRRHNTNMSALNRAAMNQAGIEIALREIRAELPNFPITRSEVADLRWVLRGEGERAEKSLATTRSALKRYRELTQAFQRKYKVSLGPDSHLGKA